MEPQLRRRQSLLLDDNDSNNLRLGREIANNNQPYCQQYTASVANYYFLQNWGSFERVVVGRIIWQTYSQFVFKGSFALNKELLLLQQAQRVNKSKTLQLFVYT
jgi:hypothetical protein